MERKGATLGGNLRAGGTHMKLLALIALSALALCGAARADLSISNKPTQNMSCDAGVCTATAKGANLNVTDLTSMLASGDATVKTGGGAITIQVLDGFSWTSSSRLTLDANHSVGIHKPVVVAGMGAVTITYNDDGSGGDLLFSDKSKLDFLDLNSNLVINGNSYTLVRNVKMLARGIAHDPSGLFALATDHNAARDGTYGLSPVRSELDGGFEGLNHSIQHLEIVNHSGDSVGLFVTIRGFVRDIQLAKLKISSENGGGGLAGWNIGTIAHAVVQGRIDGGRRLSRYTGAGGLAGSNDGEIIDSSVNINVEGNTAGGLVGFDGGLIRQCRASGTVVGRAHAGGLTGREEGLIDQSFSTASVSLKAKHGALAGGLTGEMYIGEIENSYAAGSISGQDYAFVGGLVGISGYAGSRSLISDTYSIGAVSAGSNAFVGGFAGRKVRHSVIEDNYWDTDTSGVAIACGRSPCKKIVGLTDAQLKSGLPNGFDPSIWGSNPDINNGYPYLLANPPPK